MSSIDIGKIPLVNEIAMGFNNLLKDWSFYIKIGYQYS